MSNRNAGKFEGKMSENRLRGHQCSPLIVQHSEALTSFIFALHLALYQPQIRHLLQVVDALIVCNQRKTLSDLSRLFHLAPDPKTLADFFRESPWTVDLIGQPRKKFMLLKTLELAEATRTSAEGEWVIPSLPTQAELAEMVGATRESVNKWLGAYEEQGLIRRAGNQLVILQPEALRKRIY